MMRSGEITVQKVKDSYRMLASEDLDARQDANHFLMLVYQQQQIWPVCQQMIANEPDPNFQFLGAQLLYQKVSGQIHSLPAPKKTEVRDFTFGQLRNTNITLQATLDRLASVCALLGCSMFMAEWPTFMTDVFEFMRQSEYCLLAGLYILERFPEELRNTNRIASGLKTTIIASVLESEQEMTEVFSKILSLNSNQSTNRCLKTMATWAESKFNFLKYPELLKNVLTLSLQDFNKLESALNMVFETIRGSAADKTESLSGKDPLKQLESYSQVEITSVQLIVVYIMENKQNFLSSGLEPEQVEVFASIIRQSLLDFGFLICEPVGFQMLEIILKFTSSPDLKTSRNTFEFWIDFSEKVSHSKLNQQTKNLFADCLLKAFQTINQKAIVPDYLLDDPDLKEDLTVDDINNITISEYRKEAVSFYQFVYDFFLSVTGKPDFFFEQCFAYIQADISLNKFGGNTELALFCIKSSTESMVSQADSANLRKIIGFVIDNASLAPPRVVAEVMLLIRDCTKQIKDEQGYSLKCLEYSMRYLADDLLSYYASDSFKSLLETFTVVNDASLVDSLLNFYSQTHGLKDIIVDKVVDGIISIIFKISDPQYLRSYIQKFMEMVLMRFRQAHEKAQADPDLEKPYFTPLMEMKAILDNYDSATPQVKDYLREYFGQVCTHSLQIIDVVIPYCLKHDYKFILMNELGLSCSIFKYVMRICGSQVDPLFLKPIEHSLLILTPQKIVEMGPMLNLLNESLIVLVSHNLEVFSDWLRKGIPHINKFFLHYFKHAGIPDPDAIRKCFEVQENLILYNQELFLQLEGVGQIFDYSLHFLRHIIEQKMQRKLVSFIRHCMDIPVILAHNQRRVLEVMISSIPILQSQAAAHFSKILTIVLSAVPADSHRPILTQLLSQNPYQAVSKPTLAILIDSTLVALSLAKERYVMMVLKDLTELANTGESPQAAMHFQFRLSMWKKELAKMHSPGV